MKENLKGVMLLFSSVQKLYGAFILWGALQGIVTYLVMILVVPIGNRTIGNAAIYVLTGSIISAVIFGLLLKVPIWLQSVGFFIVGALLPYAVMIVWASLDYRRPVVQFDPLATLLTLLLTACSMPFALFTAVVYFCIHLILRNRVDIVQQHPSTHTE